MLQINLSDEQKKWLDDTKKFIDNKKWKEALEYIERIQKNMEGPHAAMIMVYRGLADRGLGNKDATQSFMTALSVVNYAPKTYGYAQFIRAEAARYLGMKPEAKESYNAVLAVDKNNKEAKEGLAAI